MSDWYRISYICIVNSIQDIIYMYSQQHSRKHLIVFMIVFRPITELYIQNYHRSYSHSSKNELYVAAFHIEFTHALFVYDNLARHYLIPPILCNICLQIENVPWVKTTNNTEPQIHCRYSKFSHTK